MTGCSFCTFLSTLFLDPEPRLFPAVRHCGGRFFLVCRSGLLPAPRLGLFDGEGDPFALEVNRQHLYLDDFSDLDRFPRILDEALRQMTDVDQSVLVHADVDKGAEGGDVGYGALEDHARLHAAGAADRERARRALAKKEPGDRDVAFLAGLVARHGGIGHAASRAREYVRRGKRFLAGLPDSTARSALTALSDYVVSRTA